MLSLYKSRHILAKCWMEGESQKATFLSPPPASEVMFTRPLTAEEEEEAGRQGVWKGGRVPCIVKGWDGEVRLPATRKGKARRRSNNGVDRAGVVGVKGRGGNTGRHARAGGGEGGGGLEMSSCLI